MTQEYIKYLKLDEFYLIENNISYEMVNLFDSNNVLFQFLKINDMNQIKIDEMGFIIDLNGTIYFVKANKHPLVVDHLSRCLYDYPIMEYPSETYERSEKLGYCLYSEPFELGAKSQLLTCTNASIFQDEKIEVIEKMLKKKKIGLNNFELSRLIKM